MLALKPERLSCCGESSFFHDCFAADREQAHSYRGTVFAARQRGWRIPYRYRACHLNAGHAVRLPDYAIKHFDAGHFSGFICRHLGTLLIRRSRRAIRIYNSKLDFSICPTLRESSRWQHSRTTPSSASARPCDGRQTCPMLISPNPCLTQATSSASRP